MRRTTAYATVCLLVVFPLAGGPLVAGHVFTIEDPPVDFEVIDADPFDGVGDNGPYSTFNDALLGTLGECRSMAEFDISPFTVPPGEFISAATFEVRITEIDVFGLGVDGQTPDSLAVDGYVGNGVAELSDFQAGDGNVLDSVATPTPQIGQVLSFDVTSFVADLVNAHVGYVGLTVRAETFGGLMVEESGTYGYPRLTIETTPEPVEGDFDNDGNVDLDDYAIFCECMSGGGGCTPEQSEACDLSGDGDIDLEDFALFQSLFPS